MCEADLEGARLRDLRRTAVVRPAEAGRTLPEIAAIGGHRVADGGRIPEADPLHTRGLAERAVVGPDPDPAGPRTFARAARKSLGEVVPREGLEPPTRALRMRCSTD